MPTAAITPEEQLEDLQKRYRLLEGEKKLEAEKLTQEIGENKEVIKRLTEEVQRLRADIDATSSRKRMTSEMSELMSLKNRINALVNENEKKQLLVNDLQTQVMLSEKNLVIENSSNQARQIRVIENRIDKAMIKYNEALSIKRTYEGILHRLREERVGLDHRLDELNEELKNKKKDHEELVRLSHEALHAKELAQAELHKFEQQVLEERTKREKEVAEKRLLVSHRMSMNQKLEEREKRIALNRSTLSVAVSEAPPAFSIDAAPVPPRSNVPPLVRSKPTAPPPPIDEYEIAFTKLREVTGASDVNEIIRKFIEQESTHSQLTAKTIEQQAVLDKLHSEQNNLQKQLEDIKFSGSSISRKQATNDMEKQLELSLSILNRNQAKHTQIQHLMTQVCSGVTHIAHKLNAKTPVGGVTTGNVEEVLVQCETALKAAAATTTTTTAKHTPNAMLTSTNSIRVKIHSLQDNALSRDEDEETKDDDTFFGGL